MLYPMSMLAILAASVFVISPPMQQKVAPFTDKDIKPLTWRSVGPANMGGRVADIEWSSSDGKSFYVGFGSGGLWKTTNRGTTFTPLFDKEVTSSIGAIAVVDAPSTWTGWKQAAPSQT